MNLNRKINWATTTKRIFSGRSQCRRKNAVQLNNNLCVYAPHIARNGVCDDDNRSVSYRPVIRCIGHSTLTFWWIVISYVINCVTYNFLIVYNCFTSYFSTQKDHASFCNRLCNCNRSNRNSWKMFLVSLRIWKKVFFHSFHRANDLRSYVQGKMHIACHCYENLKRQEDIANAHTGNALCLRERE